MHAIHNNIILPNSNITYWKSGIFFVKAQSALLMLIEHQTTKPEGILKLSQIIPKNCWIICKINVITERSNSRVELHEKNGQPRKI